MATTYPSRLSSNRNSTSTISTWKYIVMTMHDDIYDWYKHAYHCTQTCKYVLVYMRVSLSTCSSVRARVGIHTYVQTSVCVCLYVYIDIYSCGWAAAHPHDWMDMCVPPTRTTYSSHGWSIAKTAQAHVIVCPTTWGLQARCRRVTMG